MTRTVVLVMYTYVAVLTFDSCIAEETSTMDILMKGAKPQQPDAYLCSSYSVTTDESYIVKFEAMADASTAHHILMYGCTGGPASEENIWPCPGMCKNGEQMIMFAWAKNAPPTEVPKGVGFRIGQKTLIRTIVLQIHYAKSFTANEESDRSGIRLHLTSKKQPYVAGIFLMLSNWFVVPPDQQKYHVDMSCSYDGENSMFPFAYRAHAHSLGSVITGYQYNGSYNMIGKGNPQWPQAFYPANPGIEIKRGQKLVGRCTYNSTGQNHDTSVGGTGRDEMCNFYIMIYTNSSVTNPYGTCAGDNIPELSLGMPAGSDVTLPPNPLLEEAAQGHHHHHAMSSTSKQENSHPTATAIHLTEALQFQPNWPTEHVMVGQVSGLAVDHDGNVYVFHRGSRMWDGTSFDMDNNFKFQNDPIMEDTILVFSRDGKLIRKFGSGRFFMPHGISVDDKKNIWVTDVALHQVMRFPANGTEPDLSLGERFVHGSDFSHFCKPSDVAVLSSGDFFVTDGYCNSRVMKFSKEGKLLLKWGKQNIFDARGEPPLDSLDIPHSVTVAEDLDLVCIADRENGRILCYDLAGTFQYQIKHTEFGSRVFALEYCPEHGGLLYAVNGPSNLISGPAVQGFTLNAKTGELLEQWTIPKGLQYPHDVAVDVAGHSVYVGELNKALWKWSRGGVPSLVTVSPNSSTTTSSQQAAVMPEKNNGSINSLPVQKQTLVAGHSNEGGDITMKKLAKSDVSEDFTPSVIIGILLVIPVVLLLIITLVVRMHHKGQISCFSGWRKPKVFTLHNILGNSHKGFDKLSQDDSDHETGALSDSDHEEFRQPIKHKA